MAKETEKKISLSKEEADDIIAKCEAIFGITVEPYLQADEYFDRDDELFKDQDFTVRLRVDHLPSGSINKVAIKGPRMFLPDNSYTRIDIEFAAASYDDFQDEIQRKNLKCVAKMEKLRWKYKKEGVKITIDQYPFVGFFLEVESSDINTIESYVRLLGLASKIPVTKNSSELLESHLKSVGLNIRPDLIATFDLEKNAKKHDTRETP